jgi:hypothetical protein
MDGLSSQGLAWKKLLRLTRTVDFIIIINIIRFVSRSTQNLIIQVQVLWFSAPLGPLLASSTTMAQVVIDASSHLQLNQL